MRVVTVILTYAFRYTHEQWSVWLMFAKFFVKVCGNFLVPDATSHFICQLLFVESHVAQETADCYSYCYKYTTQRTKTVTASDRKKKNLVFSLILNILYLINKHTFINL